MRENVRHQLARLAKWGAIGSLTVIVAVVGLRVFRSKVPSVEVKPPTDVASPAGGGKVDRKEGIEHVLFKGDTGKIKVKADRFFVGEDKLNHLEGNVEIVDYGRKGAREITITADRVDYDLELSHFQAAGRARVGDGDAVIESPSLDYDKTKEIFQTDRGAVFSSSRLKARGNGFVYRKRNDLLEFSGDVAIQLLPKEPSAGILAVTGDSFVYRRKARSGRVEGAVTLSRGKSRGGAEKLSFILTPDEQEVRAMTLQGAARALFYREEPGAPSSSPQEITADEIWMLAFPREQTVSRLRTKGASSLKVALSAGSNDEILADSAVLYFDRTGNLKDFLAKTGVRMKMGTGKGEEERRISGDRVTYHKKTGILKAVGVGNVPARIVTSRSEVEANAVQIGMQSGDMAASNAVKLVLNPIPDRQAVGFFAKDKPVLITCGTFKSEKEKKRFVFSDNVRIWQDKDVILAGEFEILEDSGELLGRKGVNAGFTHKPAGGGEEKRLSVTGETMRYDPKEKKIAFEGKCVLETPQIHLTSGALDIRFGEDGREMERLLARTKVVIVQDNKEGRGEDADYDLRTDTVVLTGNPVLVDKDKGVTEGDKLTFKLADGKILIENKEKDRSATVIKS
jgi:lipopolysaccharide transport protein LptA